MSVKVVIENAVLKGFPHGDQLQHVAKVYINGEEIRVLAPPKATGKALEWIDHWSIRELSKTDFGVENILEYNDFRRTAATQAVKDELETQDMASDIWNWGQNPDAHYYAAQICLLGHVHNVEGKTEFKRNERCPQCGNPCIDSCQNCKAPIRGRDLHFLHEYQRPSFCYNCGRPYPWMKDRLDTARELLNQDDKLSLEEREKLWGLLQHVMSDPKSDLAPAKKKLFELGLGKAAAATKDVLLDFVAKYAAEMSKP